ncbi:outer membrane protein [Hydrogenovibrio kuenenii]|uniref:outer membrane protein n=1 Tax=Hydrogenovibrio kuenenii TaxID=63658 RepID=UPI000462F1AE|nr:outer membrane beta-barrel protein [Hydrogenovibrio kuenenii]
MTIKNHKAAYKALGVALITSGALFFTATSAYAGSDSYVSMQLETGQQQDSKRSTPKYTSNISYHSPTAFKFAYGKHYGQYRLEGEFGYAKSTINEIIGHYGQQTDESGHEEYYSLMVNGLMDFKNTTNFTPYLGAGLGAVDVHNNVSYKPLATTGTLTSDHYSWVWGYQAMAGVNWKVKPKMDVSFSYRYFATGDHTHQQSSTSGSTTVPDIKIQAARIQFIGLGLRYAF